MRIAFVGNLPAASIFPAAIIRERDRTGNHPAPWIVGLLPALARATDFELRLIVVQRALLRHSVIEHDGVEYEGVPSPFPERWHLASGYWTKVPALRRAVRRFRPDLVHAFGMETGAGTLALRTGFPVSCFIQGIAERLAPYLSHRSRRESKTLLVHEAEAVRRIRWFVAETRFARDWANGHNPTALVSLIPHPVRAEFFDHGAPTFAPQVITVGGLDDRKGMDTVIRAFARIQHPAARLCVVGSGPHRDRLIALRDSLACADRIEFAGSLESGPLIERLNVSSVLVIGSRMDTSPNVITEAHAVGLPVIGTRTGGIPEMIDEGVDGHLVDVDDAQAMADRIEVLLDDPAAARRMGQAGRLKVTDWNHPAKVAAAHVDFFEQVKRDLQARSTPASAQR